MQVLLLCVTTALAQQHNGAASESKVNRVGHVNRYGRDANPYIIDDRIIPDVIAFTAEGGLFGIIRDTGSRPIAGALIKVYSNDTIVARVGSNDSGDYHLSLARSGRYMMTIQSPGKYDSTFILRVVPGSEITIVDFVLTDLEPLAMIISGSTSPGRQSAKPLRAGQILSDKLKLIPSVNIADAVTLLPGIYQSQRGKDISCDGARTTGNIYIIDGMVALTGQ